MEKEFPGDSAFLELVAAEDKANLDAASFRCGERLTQPLVFKPTHGDLQRGGGRLEPGAQSGPPPRCAE